MSDSYRIAVDVKSNINECFRCYNGDNDGIDYWEDDFVEAIYKEFKDSRIKYKDFLVDIDFTTGSENPVFIRIMNDGFTDWEDDTKWYKFIEDANREKEQLLTIINTDIIDPLNSICSGLKICKFPDDNFLYNRYDKSFYVIFNSPNIDSVQLKFDYLDDIDFENF